MEVATSNDFFADYNTFSHFANIMEKKLQKQNYHLYSIVFSWIWTFFKACIRRDLMICRLTSILKIFIANMSEQCRVPKDQTIDFMLSIRSICAIYCAEYDKHIFYYHSCICNVNVSPLKHVVFAFFYGTLYLPYWEVLQFCTFFSEIFVFFVCYDCRHFVMISIVL